MKFIRSFVCITLAILLLLGLGTVAFAVHPFNDVPQNSWYNESVDYVYNNEMMSGTSAATFGPNVAMTRAMLVTVLYRLADSPATNGMLPFKDVSSDAYYYAPVLWCYSNGIVAGTSASTFSPDMNITREQMVAIFAKYAAYKGLSTRETADLTIYKDKNEISAYAVNAFAWAVNAGIISGTSQNTLTPQGNATRSQCAVILQRFAAWAETGEAPDISPDITPEINPTPAPTPNQPPAPTPNNGLVGGETAED